MKKTPNDFKSHSGSFRVYLKTVNMPKQWVFFRLLCTIFPCNTQSIPAEKWLQQAKNPSLLVIFPVFR